MRRTLAAGAWMTAGLLGLLTPAQALDIRVEPEKPVPGEVLRIELKGLDNPRRADCRLDGRSYPFYPTGIGALRALIGLTAREDPGEKLLRVTVSRFLLPDAVMDIPVEVRKRRFTHQKIRLSQKKASLPSTPAARSGTRRIRAALGRDSAVQRWEGAFLRPSEGRRTSQYGHSRTINDGMVWSWHKGIDLAAPRGTPVHAPNGGVVRITRLFPIQGRTVVLDHGQGLMSVFYHLRAFQVSEGDSVAQGDLLGEIGTTGFSTGPHLHWGTYLHGAPVDPERLLDREL